MSENKKYRAVCEHGSLSNLFIWRGQIRADKLLAENDSKGHNENCAFGGKSEVIDEDDPRW